MDKLDTMSPPLWSAVWRMIFAALCFTIMNGIVREVDHLPTLEIVFFRGLGSLVICWVVLGRRRLSPMGKQPRLLLTRAVLGLSSMSLYYWAIQLMPLGTAVTLRYLSPFFAVALATVFLGEQARPIQWLFLVGAFAGVVLIKGFDASLSTLGLVVILSSAVLSGGVYFVIRKIGSSEESIVIVHYFIALATLVGAVSCLFEWVTPVGREWILLGGFGILGYAAQYTMTQALQTTASHIITPFKYMEVVFTLLAGWLVYMETYAVPVMLGITLIMLCLWGNVHIAQSTASSKSYKQ